MHVIDCLSRTVVPSTSATKDYATLSYVWGNQLPGITEFQNRILGSLPKVVEDAILLVRRLGIRYLWVDRYCIPQDDTSTRHLQIQNMGKIYGNSTLTVIAVAGADLNHGLPGMSPTQKTPA
jgi:Heterokaryon incompatibility protein (HET)